MAVFIRFFLCFAFIVTLALPALAQKPGLSFYTVKDWAYAGGQSCNLSNEFNNGFLMQFNGRDGVLSSLSLVSTAQNESTLVMGIAHRGDVYQALRSEGALDIEIEGNEFRFFLGAFEEASRDFSQCLSQSVPSLLSRNEPNIEVSTKSDSVVWSAQPEANAPISLLEGEVASVGISDVQVLEHAEVSKSKAGLAHLGIQEDSKFKVQREVITGRADFVNEGDELAQLRRENADLRDELNLTLREAQDEEFSIKSNNWDLERASMLYQESERQVQTLGQKLQRQERKCTAEKQELEALLFDPIVTSEQQLSKLATLEDELADAQEELELQRLRYDERIRLLALNIVASLLRYEVYLSSFAPCQGKNSFDYSLGCF